MSKYEPKISHEEKNFKIISFPTRTPWPPGHSNAYLIVDEPVTLIDTGIGTEENINIVESFLESRKISPPRRIFITHGHIDHYGAIGLWSKKYPDIKIFCHKEDAFKLKKTVSESLEENREKYRDFFSSQGVPLDLITRSGDMLKVLDGVVFPVDKVEEVDDGFLVEFENSKLKVIHTPGHSPGEILLLEENRKILFSGDHILMKKPPTPLVEATRGKTESRNLIDYILNLNKVKNLEVDLVYPGHWKPVEDISKKVEELIAYYRKMMKEVEKILADDLKPLTPYEITRILFPEMPEGVFFLGISEVLGVLALLNQEKRVKRFEEKGKIYYRLY